VASRPKIARQALATQDQRRKGAMVAAFFTIPPVVDGALLDLRVEQRVKPTEATR